MRRTGIKLALFTAFTIFITIALATIIGGFSLFANTYSVKARLDDATGILVGDLVKIAGVNVGRVTGFEVEEGQAILTLSVKKDVPLPEDVEVEIKFRNLLGQRVVNLVRPESPSSVALRDGDVIPSSQTRPALDLSIVFNNLRPLIQSTNPEDINTVARAVLKIFKGREGDLEAVLGNVGVLSKTLSGGGGRLADLVGDLDKVAKLLNQQSGSIRTGLGRFTELTESLADVTPTIERVVVQLEDASSKFGGIISRNRDNLNQEIADLTTILGVVNDNLGPLNRVAKNLKEVLLATGRAGSYGKWLTLYVVNLCPELGDGSCVGLP